MCAVGRIAGCTKRKRFTRMSTRPILSLNLHLEIAGDIAAQHDELQQSLDQEASIDQGIPDVASSIAMFGSRRAPMSATASIAEVLPAGIVPRAQLPLNKLRLEASLYRGTLLHAGLSQLPVSNTPVAQSAVSQDGLRAIDLRASQEAPRLSMSSSSGLTPKLPRLNLAAGSRYRVETQPRPDHSSRRPRKFRRCTAADFAARAKRESNESRRRRLHVEQRGSSDDAAHVESGVSRP